MRSVCIIIQGYSFPVKEIKRWCVAKIHLKSQGSSSDFLLSNLEQVNCLTSPGLSFLVYKMGLGIVARSP